ncbi:conserved Plasmodium protein, unknown function [Plasmodium berghei]|uniref:Uncharacterized protein n=2 Tax=Plasmodium berghei TaxID=5821 RepID=A0A509AQR4_PLABA|nr:conserved protein, unknown function [Plasmodium berghei ANKA]CXJ19750.1 conserved Plasmodium protein, unknown function [Plasmodium berghei]SCM26506.1 conserved Plasmodium protein, unknown function [Plasmodium berghei]SCN28492.1 conserved Plasmodium protein, unknown function [Plasmodium berghei]SCO62682.1 conserved Plasmodium protein, unknown function [Plasmodium berghei]SCO64243.1 conserved Plasmodium protein, unknown function [Plasmodium berghei]|eukprot:XP_034424138.1 conserved protein, unknown function [Plasmodium berghei ANKA]
MTKLCQIKPSKKIIFLKNLNIPYKHVITKSFLSNQFSSNGHYKNEVLTNSNNLNYESFSNFGIKRHIYNIKDKSHLRENSINDNFKNNEAILNENSNEKEQNNVEKIMPEEYGYKFDKHEPTMFGDWSHNCRVTDF